MIKLINLFLKKNGYADINIKDIEMQIKIHPDFPSFKSITDTFDYFKIENAAVQVPINILNELPEYFITIFRENGEEEIVLAKKNEESIFITSNKASKKYNITSFKEAWIPKIIMVEKKENAQPLFLRFKAFVFISVVSILGLIYLNEWNSFRLAFLVLVSIGLFLGILALNEELGYTSEKVNKFCSSLASSCSEVIRNGNSKVFKKMSLALIGTVFFSSLFLYTLFHELSIFLFIPLFGAALFCLYSIYLQAFVIKQWCSLCNSIILIVICLTGSSFMYIENDNGFDGVFALILIAIISYFVTFKIIALEKRNKELTEEYYDLNKFKRDIPIFNHLFHSTPAINNDSLIAGEIVLGNPQASFKIISLTNPFCGHCKNAFDSYLNILEDSTINICIRLRFLVNPKDNTSSANLVALRLHEIYENNGGGPKVMEAYKEWFENRDAEEWFLKFGRYSESDNDIEKVLIKQWKWAIEEGFRFTPTTIINGYIYPTKYNYKELPFFIKELYNKKNENSEDFNIQPSLA